MFKKSLLSLLLAAMLVCSVLFGCSAPEASSSSSASATAESSASSITQASRESDTIEVSVAFDVDLLEGTTEAEGAAPYRGPQDFNLEEGATAYDALVATGVEIDGTPSYVTSINGVGEGLAGSASGWMYMVNDEMPSLAANEYILEEGDAVVWYYGSWS